MRLMYANLLALGLAGAVTPAAAADGPTIVVSGEIRNIRNDAGHLYYQVVVQVSYANATAGQEIAVQVYDENAGQWAWMTASPQFGTVHTVPKGVTQGVCHFHYNIAAPSDWDDDITSGAFPMAAVTGYIGDTCTGPLDDDSAWVYYAP